MKTNNNLNIEFWSMTKLIEYYYPSIQSMTTNKALKMKVDAEELQSQVNYRIGLAVTNNSFTGQTQAEFLGWINTMITNAGIDAIRRRKRDAPYLVDADLLEFDADQASTTKIYQTCNSHKNLLKDITSFIEKRYKGKSNSFYIDIYHRVLINGEKYHEVATDMKTSINNISGAIGYIRKAIDQKFHSEYTELIND